MSNDEFKRLMNAPQPKGFGVGQIWSTFQSLTIPDVGTFHTDEPRLVAVLGGVEQPTVLTAAIISLDVHMASEYDMVTGKDSPFGFGFMIEAWNETPVYHGHMRRFIANLPDHLLKILMQIYTAHLSLENVPEELDKWNGPHIYGKHDPRLAFQESEVTAAAYLANAASAMFFREHHH